MSKFIKNISKAATIQEAAKISGLDFEVAKTDLVTHLDGEEISVDDFKSIIRTDTKKVLGIVGSGWEPYQPCEGLAVMGDLMEQGVLKPDTAGVFAGGKSIWMQGTLGESGFKNDPVRNNIFFSTGFAGNRGTSYGASRTRPVCWNTLMMMLEEKSKLTVKHTRYSKERIDAMIEEIGLMKALYERDDQFNLELARLQAKPSIVDAFLNALIPNPDGDKNPKRAESKRELLEELLRSGQGSDIHLETGLRVRDSLYGLRQATTEYVNHHRGTRKSNGSSAAEKRFESLVFGSGGKFIQQADDLLKTILDKGIVEEHNPIDAVHLMEELTI